MVQLTPVIEWPGSIADRTLQLPAGFEVVKRSPLVSPATHVVVPELVTHETDVRAELEIVDGLAHVIGSDEAGPPLPESSLIIVQVVGLCGPLSTLVPLPPTSSNCPVKVVSVPIVTVVLLSLVSITNSLVGGAKSIVAVWVLLLIEGLT